LIRSAATAATSTPLWIVDSRLGSTLLRVDPATGTRSFVDVSAYPLVLALGTAGMQSPTDEQLYLEAVNAAQGAVLIRYDPGSGEVVGISGYVGREGDGLRGAENPSSTSDPATTAHASLTPAPLTVGTRDDGVVERGACLPPRRANPAHRKFRFPVATFFSLV